MGCGNGECCVADLPSCPWYDWVAVGGRSPWGHQTLELAGFQVAGLA